MSEYIPYIIRNNITDLDLAWLLDYLEREMGLEILLHKQWENFEIKSGTYSIQKIFNTIYFFIFDGNEEIRIISLHRDLFFRTYKTFLPVIRDLYSK